VALFNRELALYFVITNTKGSITSIRCKLINQ